MNERTNEQTNKQQQQQKNQTIVPDRVIPIQRGSFQSSHSLGGPFKKKKNKKIRNQKGTLVEQKPYSVVRVEQAPNSVGIDPARLLFS